MRSILSRRLRAVAATALLLALAPAARAAMRDEAVRDEAATGLFIPGHPAEGSRGVPIWTGPAGPVLFDNGPFVNSPGTGFDGADESRLQATDLMMTTLGYGYQLQQEARLADQFTVPAGHYWLIDRITFFGYQVGVTTTSTFTSLNYQIWDGPLTDGDSRVVFGDTTTNRLLSSTWTGAYRVRESDSGTSADRAVMANVGSAGVLLLPGTYYVDFQADGTLPVGPLCPPVTINGTAETGDAIQSNDGGKSWEGIVDGGSEAPQGLPFIVEGTSGGLGALDLPALGGWGLAALVLSLAGAAVLVLRRSRA